VNVTLISKTWRVVDGTTVEVPQRVVVELTTPEAMRIANGGTVEPMELYEGPRSGDSKFTSHHIGTLEVRRLNHQEEE